MPREGAHGHYAVWYEKLGFLMESRDCALQNSKSKRALGTLLCSKAPSAETQEDKDWLSTMAAFVVFHESLCLSLVHS